MKKILTLCLIMTSIILCSCKDKNITTFYAIGCLSYSGELTSDWDGFQNYMESHTTYNTEVSFTNPSQELNDDAARAYFDAEYAKINEEEVCSFIEPGDCVIYGIGTSIDSTSYNVVKAVRIYSDHIAPYEEATTK